MPGRSILITGCSSGIGRHAALGLRERGYRVFATARREQDVEALAAEGLEALRLDLDDSDSIAVAVEAVRSRCDDSLYGLFNNGAYGQTGAVEDLRRDVLRRQFETNLFGTHELTNLLIPSMRARGEGRIVQNSSILGFIPLPFRGAYVATKYALEGLSDTLRMELRGSGIHVSLIEPGPILSRFRANSLRAFEENIDVEHSVHRESYQAQLLRLRKEGAAQPFTLGPEAVLAKLVHALESPRPKHRYYVTFPTYLFAFLQRVIGRRGVDAFLRRTAAGGRQ